MSRSEHDMHISLPPPAFPQGPANRAQDYPLNTTSPSQGNELTTPSKNRRQTISFSPLQHPRYSIHRYRSIMSDDGGAGTPISERPPIPSALPISSNTDTIPLPKIPMIVLSIAVLGEFLSANVSTPFLVDMVKGFNLGDEAELGSYTGMIVAAFFVTQFLTSLLWATVAGKHGNRAVLFVALFGNAITCTLFGTCKSFSEAVTVRLIQGVFNGAVGVARSSVINVTDPTNESRAYAIMGFSWGLGGVAGAIIGGAFETPAKRWPTSFGRIVLFQTYPYLLPPMIASTILLSGAILSLFLAWDGGPRQGAIRLLPEKQHQEEEHTAAPIAINLGSRDSEAQEEPSQHLSRSAPGPLGHLKQSVNKKISGYFARRVREAHAEEHQPSSPSYTLATPSSPPGPSLLSHAMHSGRTFSRTSRANGSAYGYRARLGSQATFASGARRGSLASTIRNRREERGGGNPDVEGPIAPREDLNFAQRLVMANEFTATSLTSLWVAAAINVDNEDPFAGSDDEMSSDEEDEIESSSRPVSDRRTTNPDSPGYLHRVSSIAGSRRGSLGIGRQNGPGHRASSTFVPFRRHMSIQSTDSVGGVFGGGRRPSTASHVLLPAIYANPGVSAPPALLLEASESQNAAASHQGPSPLGGAPADPFADSALAPIIEGDTALHAPQNESEAVASASAMEEGISEKTDLFRWTLLPLFIIFQYFVLALHSTSHDQVFLMYLTSPYAKGGLGLDPGHFATLVALMCIAQVIYQFYLYPNLGPPRGKYSHLAMFRIGSALFIPGYVTVVFYRQFASSAEDGNFVVMSLLAISTAVRYAGSTFAYTSIAVLLNYMSPPHLVAFSNGLAQSLASLARVLGPLLGGALWSESTMHNPDGFPLGFYACAILCSTAIFLSFFIR